MWRWWKQKLTNMFREEDRTQNEKISLKHDLPIKVTYQYPKERTFKFPVIPDEYSSTETTKLTNKKHRHSLNKNKSELPLHNVSNTELENIPAFIRRQQKKHQKRITDDRKAQSQEQTKQTHSIIDHVKETNEARRRIAERNRKKEFEKFKQNDQRDMHKTKSELTQNDVREINKKRKDHKQSNLYKKEKDHGRKEQFNELSKKLYQKEKQTNSTTDKERLISQTVQRMRQNHQHVFENQSKLRGSIQPLVKNQTNKKINESKY